MRAEVDIRQGETKVRHPNFFIVGAPKAGTTSLCHYLRQHTDIFMPGRSQEKEPSFFSEARPVWGTQYRVLDDYLSVFREARDQKAVGEASVVYLFRPESASRIREQYPEAKILMSLRNPADRAFSMYKFLCNLGLEWISPFERALGLENERKHSEAFREASPFWFGAYLYFESGLYYEQVIRYFEVFPREQIHVLLFDDLKRNPKETVEKIYEFLEVETDFPTEFKIHNRSNRPLLPWAQWWFGHGWEGDPFWKSRQVEGLLNKSYHELRRAAYLSNLVLGKLRTTKIDPAIRRELLDRYEPDIRRTAKLIGRDLDFWLEDRPS